ncbi:MAG: TrkH family potassium uptake protein [Tabrizicola sp.]|jgi:trk system potassium uptake protein TrkH|nr:TrkH family potassium uptake protein [Tabrizicola sp.]
MLARLAELPLLVVLIGLCGVLAFLPAGYAVVVDQTAVGRDFFYSALIILILAVMLGIATAAYSPRDPARSQLAALVAAYIVLPLVTTLPILEAVPDTSFANAWFEMLSAFTTTGATVYAPDRLPDAVHLWRASVGWFGGFLTLLAAYAILAPLNLGGSEVASGRVPGRSASGTRQITRTAEPAERLTRFALKLFPVYTGLTLVLWVALLIAGDRGVTALIHAMGTLSTSGISGQTALGESASGLWGEALILAFLIFAITRRALPGTGLTENRRPLLGDPELRLAGLIVLTVVTILFLRHWIVADAGTSSVADAQALPSLWGTIFTATSFLTTTGYISASWETGAAWSGIGTPGLVLMALAIIGGGTATTAGGVKLLRVYALLRHGERELERIIHPNSIGHGGSEVRRLWQEGAQIAWVFFMLFAASIAVTVALLSLEGIAFEPALVLAIAALTTTGQLAELGAAEPILYADLSTNVKAILGLAMIVGRLETLALLALILPGRSRR